MSASYAVVRWRSSTDPVAESRGEMTWDEMREMLAPGAALWRRRRSARWTMTRWRGRIEPSSSDTG